MRRRPRLDSTGVLLSLFYITAGERTTIFRLAVIINFTVDVQPGFLFIRGDVFHDIHKEDFVQTPFPYSKPVKLECAYCLSNYSRDLQCQSGRRLAVESSDLAPQTLFPNLNVNCFARLERFAGLNSQQCVRLAQA